MVVTCDTIKQKHFIKNKFSMQDGEPIYYKVAFATT